MSKIVSISISTLGNDPKTCSLLEIGAVVEELGVNTPLASLMKFHTYLLPRVFTGDDYIISKKQDVIKRVGERNFDKWNFMYPEDFSTEFFYFLKVWGGINEVDNKMRITMAGRNPFSFQIPFLKTLPHFDDLFEVNSFSIDPLQYYYPEHQTLKTVYPDKPYPHDTLERSLYHVELIRESTKKK